MANLLGLDIGEKRIGVAIADAKTPFPAPLTTLEASADLPTVFASLLHSHSVKTVVIGYPRNQQGEPTAQTERVEYIVSLLKIPKSIVVQWQDESLTSVKAEAELEARKKPYKKADVDALAATYILDDYIQSAAYIAASQKTIEAPVHHELLPEHATADTKTSKKPKKTLFRKVIALILVIVATAVASVIAWYLHALTPLTNTDQYTVVSVRAGSGTQQIADDLESKSVIRSATAFTTYVRLNGINNLQAGSYRLSSKQSTPDIAKVIAGGDVTTLNVLISPGLRLDQITKTLMKEGYSEAEIEAAYVAVRDHPLLKGYPASDPLEGYLYPETFQIEPNTSAEVLVRTILTTFNTAITPEIRTGLKEQGLTLQEGIILASIVQKEVSDPDVQRTVAQVFIKRYKEGMVLGSDVTYKYAAAQFGTVDNPSSNSPFNTRKYLGLPPTAISNFNLSALKAVAKPTDTEYVYFVAGDNGITYFATTLEQHEANVAKYCIKGCG